MNTNGTLALTEGLDLRLYETIAEELSPATRKAYLQQLTLLKSFYASKGWEVFVDSGEVFILHFLDYLQHQANAGRSISTLNKIVSALRWEASYTHPAHSGLLASRPVRAFMVGLGRQQKARTTKKAQALTVAQVKNIHGFLSRQAGVVAVRNRAWIALGIATALRSSSLGELTIGDVKKAVLMDGLVVTVRFSKTDQSGEGVTIPVKRASNALVCPVRAVLAWVKVLEGLGLSDASQPLFPRIRKSVVTAERIENPNVTGTNILRNVLVDAGLFDEGDAVVFSSHSLRSTFITLSSQAGVPEADIAAISGHKSMKVLRSYDRSSVERHAQTSYLGE